MEKRKIEIMDTTLRDGEQTSGVSFSAAEKLSYQQRQNKVWQGKTGLANYCKWTGWLWCVGDPARHGIVFFLPAIDDC